MQVEIKKTKALTKIEEKLLSLPKESFRYQVLDSARTFKRGWIEFGQYLFTVYQDKLYKDWDYMTFEGYCKSEVGIKKDTAAKLMRSYRFLEEHEPAYVTKDYFSQKPPKKIPDYEAVNTLRLARSNKNINEEAYNSLREDVLESNKDEKEVKKTFRYILQEAKDIDPSAKGEKDAMLYLKRLRGMLASIQNNKEFKKYIGKDILTHVSTLSKALDEEIA